MRFAPPSRRRAHRGLKVSLTLGGDSRKQAPSSVRLAMGLFLRFLNYLWGRLSSRFPPRGFIAGAGNHRGETGCKSSWVAGDNQADVTFHCRKTSACRRMANRDTLGITSFRSSRRFARSSGLALMLKPVIFAPGRARLWMSLHRPGR
jgi:hypothetical protein